MDVIPNAEMLWIGPEKHRSALSAYLTAARKGLSLVDCSSFEVMRRTGIREAFAFDPDFETAGFETL